MRPGATTSLAFVGGALTLVVAFVLLVFGDKVDTMPFVISMVTIGATAMGVVFDPKLGGHILAAIMGLAALVGGVFSIKTGMHPTMAVTLITSGLLMNYLVYLSLLTSSRAAWAFLVAMTAVLFVCMFFGAPKVRSLMGISIWYALIAPGLLITATVALSVIYKDYESRLSSG